MEAAEDDDNLKLVKASASLLAELERDLPKLLWRKPDSEIVHRYVKQHDLNRVVALVEPFQGEPQLLDARLKRILPPIVEAYLQFLTTRKTVHKSGDVEFESAVCSLLYTLCKVRGYKIILGFFNNEPRYLEPILEALERHSVSEDQRSTWQVPYVLLLWLSHLLLAPFDLISISAKAPTTPAPKQFADLPSLVLRVLHIGLSHLDSPTKAQDAAAAMLCRLCRRPDVQKVGLATILTNQHLDKIEEQQTLTTSSIYSLLGSLRFISGVAASAELSNLIPKVYRICVKAFDDESPPAVFTNAVAKKLAIKIFRNVALLSLRSVGSDTPLLSFLQTTSVLEDVIDYLLRSLGDKDTPVRFAAAKAISLVVSALDEGMGHEIIQVVLDTFKEDMPRSAAAADFTMVNALRWHGLTLALAQTLFKRSASPEQLPEILDTLVMALQFQQRTATGTVLGTNVRDAANFGIWSLARRYTTAELSSVNASRLRVRRASTQGTTIVQLVAIELILSACLDPAGNIRRGSSAALQELVGRHPDQVHEGIALVQIVDYLAVGLRSRAMISVASGSAALHEMYWLALLDGLLGWRGISSADVASRESAATSIAQLAVSRSSIQGSTVLSKVATRCQQCALGELEELHGISLALAHIITRMRDSHNIWQHVLLEHISTLLALLEHHQAALSTFSPRLLRSEYPASLAKFITALCHISSSMDTNLAAELAPHMSAMDSLTDQLLWRHEDWILTTIPDLVRSLLVLKQHVGLPLGCIGIQVLSSTVALDGTKSTFHSAGRAIALGSLAPMYGSQTSDVRTAIDVFGNLMSAMNVDWRVIATRGIQLAIENFRGDTEQADTSVLQSICTAIHRGLNDYTIDERGDVGSLVRLQCISCTAQILQKEEFRGHDEIVQILKADIYRLSLEKLDRVRLQAALCRRQSLDFEYAVSNISSISSYGFFEEALRPLSLPATPPWIRAALLEGSISSAGFGNESLLVAARDALTLHLTAISTVRHLEGVLTTYTHILKKLVLENGNTHPALELLAYLLDMRIPHRLLSDVGCPTFKWINLLSLVQKSHHKSNDLPKILAAVHVYLGLADVEVVRSEVLKKLLSMLKTNPYPRVRTAVVEALWITTGDGDLKSGNWMSKTDQSSKGIEELRTRLFEE